MVNPTGNSDSFGLHERLDLLERGGVVSSTARSATERAWSVIAEFCAAGADDETAGQLVTHLAVALTRLDLKEPAPDLPTTVGDEIAGRTAEWRFARELAAGWEADFGQPLPEAEIGYLVVHLSVLRNRSGFAE